MISTRRRALAGVALLPLLAAAGCTISTSGSTTSGTLNVQSVVNYFTAAENAASLLLVLPSISGPLGLAGVAAAKVVMATLSAALTEFQAAAGNSVTVSLDTSSVKSAVDSGLAAMESLLTQFQGVLTSLTSTQVTTQVTEYVDALQTVVSLMEALVPTINGSTVTATYAVPMMPESQALSILRVR